MNVPSGRPAKGEFADYAADDIAFVAGDDAIAALQHQRIVTMSFFSALDESAASKSYAPGKWTLKEMLGHLIDDERVFAYRALCVARNDSTPLLGFDENLYVRFADFATRSMNDLLQEYDVVRQGTLSLLRPLSAEAWRRCGNVNGYSASARGLAFHIVGHEMHHLRVAKEKYLG